MDKNKNMPKGFQERYDEIISKISALAKDFGICEYNLFFTKYSNTGHCEFTFNNYLIQHPNNLDAYKDKLDGLKYTLLETQRFKDVLNLKEFKVVCLDDSMSQEVRDMLIEKGGDWITRGEEYLVYKKKKSIGDIGGFAFFLKDSDGQCLVPPYPFEGWISSRFQIIDYTKLN